MFDNNVSLKPYNTFGIECFAEKFTTVNSLEQLTNIVSHYKDLFLLSGGSNILLTKNISKPVLHVNTKGIEIISEDEGTVKVKVQAGENWHDFVIWCIERDFGGLENLSLIPGNVGTSPLQNIGAYGVEIKDTFEELEALEISSNTFKSFKKEDCNFGYRESVFKNIFKGQFIVTSVTFKLSKKNHSLKTSYGAIQEELSRKDISNPTIKDVSDAVITIRKSKLPDPLEIGNSGSFFKNPVIDGTLFEKLKKKYPEMPSYQISDDSEKIPAGWLIEKCGFKGKRFGETGVHHQQALVLVNYGNATGLQILDLANTIKQCVKTKFEIPLEIEVNII